MLSIELLTGLFDTALRIADMEAGADEFTSKPIGSEVLLARVRSLLRVKHLTDQLGRTENVICALACIVEARDTFTDRRLWRLAECCRAMVEALGCSAIEAKYAW